MGRYIFLSVILALFGCLQSCVVIPVPGDSEYSEEKLAEIEIGTTTRQQVYDLLGPARLIDPQGPGVMYSDVRTSAFVATAWFADTVKANDSVYFEFDDQDVLTFRELFEFNDSKVCLSNGVCIIRNPVTHAVNFVMFLRPPEEDDLAKQFKSEDDSCSVYLYGNTSLGYGDFDAWHFVLIDESVVGILQSPDTYMYLLLPPGDHEVSVPPAHMWGEWGSNAGCFFCQTEDDSDPVFASLSIDCKAGSTNFLKLTEQSKTKGMFDVRYIPVEFRLELVTDQAGKSNVVERDLVSATLNSGDVVAQ